MQVFHQTVQSRRGNPLPGILLAVLAGALGCAGSGKIALSPLSVTEQQVAVLEVVPLRTLRTEAERKLQAAGIQFTPGANPSIYYCDVWNRPDGSRWQIDVALLFDKEGRLYATRQAAAQTEVLERGPPTRAPLPRTGNFPTVARPAGASSLPGSSSSGSVEPESVGNSRGASSRTPFGK